MQKISFGRGAHPITSRVLQTSSLAMLVASSVSIASAQEQAAPPQSDAAVEQDATKVVITGSRIRGVAPVGSSLIQLGADDIRKSGAVTTADLLKEVPQITAMGFNGEGSLGAAAPQNITRATAPNLRGIGPQATLTLLDGQRVPSAGTMGSLVDPSFLPPLALQRVEVIADGASAIYGSDAVAGVINLIPRKRFQGVETMARVGYADGYRDSQISALAGSAWGSGSAVLSLDFAHNSALFNRDRDFISTNRQRIGGADGRATTCAPGTLSYGGKSYPLSNGNGQGVLISGLTAGAANRCDVTTNNTLLPETDRASVFGYAEQKISADAKLYAQAFYYSREARTVRSQYTITNYTVPRTNAFYPADALASTTPLLVSYSFDSLLGPNFADVSSKVYQLSTGLDGDLGDYHYKLSVSTGQGKDEENNSTALSNFALAKAMASADPTTAINVFGGASANSAALIQQLASGVSVIGGTSRLSSFSAAVDGPLLAVPAGQVRFAVGADLRRESTDASTLNSASSRTSTVPVLSESKTSRSIKAVYGELLVPLVGAASRLPGVEQLDLSLAGRWEQYSDFGSTSKPKVGVNWKAAGGVLLHASYGTSFRAPSLSESNPRASGSGIYLGQTNVAGRGLVNTATLAGGNPSLEPEKATTKSFGIDLSPATVPGLKASLTYFDIAYDNQVVDGFGLQGNYLLDPVTYAKYVAYPGAANYGALQQLITNSGLTSPSPINYGDVTLIDARKTNTAAVNVHGLDLQLSNVWRLGQGASFTLRGNWTHYLKYEEAINGKTFLDRNNVIAYPARNSGRISGAWRQGGWSAQLAANYTNGYSNNLSLLRPVVASYTTLDTDLAYTFTADGLLDGVRLALNVRNLLDKEPPPVDYSTGYDPSKASALGRMIAITLNKAW